MTELQVQNTKLALDAYPAAILQNAGRLADVDRQVTELKRAIANYEAEIEYAVAFDPDLKNELQRKATINFAKLEHVDYQNKLTQLDELNTQRAAIGALLEALKSEQSIAKLEVKLAIVSRLGSADAVDLLGV